LAIWELRRLLRPKFHGSRGNDCHRPSSHTRVVPLTDHRRDLAATGTSVVGSIIPSFSNVFVKRLSGLLYLVKRVGRSSRALHSCPSPAETRPVPELSSSSDGSCTHFFCTLHFGPSYTDTGSCRLANACFRDASSCRLCPPERSDFRVPGGARGTRPLLSTLSLFTPKSRVL